MRFSRIVCGLLSCLPFSAQAAERPFIWWTKEDASAIQKQLEAGGDAERQYEITREATTAGRMLGGKAEPLWDLFQWMVKKDEAARDRQLAALRAFIGTQPETDSGGRWVVGNASGQ